MVEGGARVNLNPCRTAVPFWVRSSQIPISLSPKRDCSSKRVNEECFSVFFSIIPFFFGGKAENSGPEVLKLSRFFRKFGYKAVEDRAAPPLELCHHSRAHKADKGCS